jgi:heat shock protein HslJ
MKQSHSFWLLLGMLIFSCQTPSKTMENKSVQDLPLAGTQWNFTTVDETPVTGIMRPAFIQFDADKGSASGSSGCNRMMGTYKLENGKLSFGQMATTRMACDEPSTKIENQILKMLEEVDGYEIRGTQLSLKQAGRVRSTLKADAK